MKQLPDVRDAILALDQIRERVLAEDREADVWAALDTAAMAFVRDQIRQCRNDFEYAAGNYFWLRQTKTAGAVLMDLWEQQQMLYDIIKHMWANGLPAWIIIHKARQLGLTTVTQGLLAWKNVFFTQQVSMILAQNPEHAAFVFGIVQHIIFKLPWWMRPAVASFERKEVMILANDGSLGEREEGMMNFIVANGANKMSSFAQGKPIHNFAATEVSTYRPASRAREIFEGDVQSALVDAPGCFAILESKPNGVNNYWHNLWKFYYSKLGKGQFYPLYIPAFFEKDRRKTPPADFELSESEKSLKEKYAMQWHRCDKCQRPVATYYQTPELLSSTYGRSAVNPAPVLVECMACGSARHSPIFLTNEQLYWYRVKYSEAEEMGKESLKKYLQEQSISPEEGFQISGIQVFPDDVYRYVQSTARPGIHGEFDEQGRFHFGKSCPVCKLNHDFTDAPLQVWELPQPGAKYVAGVDTSTGTDDGDYSVIHIIKIGYGFPERGGMPDVQVLEWRGKAGSVEMARICYIIGQAYNWAKMVIEVRGYGSGETVMWNLFSKLGYQGENFVWKHYDKLSNPNTNAGGFYTNFHTKKLLIANALDWLRQKLWEVRSPEFLNEMPSFTRDMDSGSLGGANRGAHDDSLMAGLLCIFGAHDSDFDSETGRIRIPDSRLYQPQPNDPEKVVWTCECTCGNKWDTGRHPTRHDTCSACGRPVNKASRPMRSQKADIEKITPELRAELAGKQAMITADYMEI